MTDRHHPHPAHPVYVADTLAMELHLATLRLDDDGVPYGYTPVPATNRNHIQAQSAGVYEFPGDFTGDRPDERVTQVTEEQVSDQATTLIPALNRLVDRIDQLLITHGTMPTRVPPRQVP